MRAVRKRHSVDTSGHRWPPNAGNQAARAFGVLKMRVRYLFFPLFFSETDKIDSEEQIMQNDKYLPDGHARHFGACIFICL